MKKPYPIIIFTLIVIAIIVVLKLQKVAVETPKIDYTKLIKIHTEQAKIRNTNALESFELEINRVITSHKPHLMIAADKAAKKAAEFESSLTLVSYLAWDKINNTSKAEEHLNLTINPIIKPAVDMLSSNINTAIDIFQSDLRHSTLLLAKDLDGLDLPEKSQLIQVEIQNISQAEFEQSLSNLGFNVAGIGVAFSYNAVSLPRIDKLIRKKAKSIALRLFGRQVIKIAASAAIAIADGPLPIGDILAIIGFGWTVYDIYQSKKEFEAELRTSISNLLMQANSNIRKKAVNYADFVLKKHQDFQHNIGAKTVQNLSK